MLPVEKPVYFALERFIDPPEFLIDLPKEPESGVPAEVSPDAAGQIVLQVQVRGEQSLQCTSWRFEVAASADAVCGGCFCCAARCACRWPLRFES